MKFDAIHGAAEGHANAKAMPKPNPKPRLRFWLRGLQPGPGSLPWRGCDLTLKVRPEHRQRFGQGVAPKLGLKLKLKFRWRFRFGLKL